MAFGMLKSMCLLATLLVLTIPAGNTLTCYECDGEDCIYYDEEVFEEVECGMTTTPSGGDTTTADPITSTIGGDTTTADPITSTIGGDTTTADPITTPEPDTTTPEPATTTPEPATTTPEPATTTPEPDTTTPEPVTTTPEPDTTTPEPVTTTPEPVTTTPEPVTTPEEPEITTEPIITPESERKQRKLSSIYKQYSVINPKFWKRTLQQAREDEHYSCYRIAYDDGPEEEKVRKVKRGCVKMNEEHNEEQACQEASNAREIVTCHLCNDRDHCNPAARATIGTVALFVPIVLAFLR